MIDLSIMLDRPCAILLDSPEKAKALFTALDETYPDMTAAWHSQLDESYNWDFYGADTCYTLYDENYDGELVLDRLFYSPRDYYEENGYEIIDFDVIAGVESELAESDMSLESFLGI